MIKHCLSASNDVYIYIYMYVRKEKEREKEEKEKLLTREWWWSKVYEQ